MLATPETHELLEVRAGLEGQVTRLAALHAEADQVAELREMVATMARHVENYPEFVAADLRFHQLLAAASGNRLLADLLTTIRSLLRVWVERAVRDAASTRLTVSEHLAIVEAIAVGDAEAAAAAMQAHMVSARTRLLGSG